MANQALILLFNVNNDRQRSIERLCRSLSVPAKAKVVKSSQYTQTMGYLAGISGFQRNNVGYPGSDFNSEMLVFSGFSSEVMDEFIDNMKKNGLPPVSLKAIITPTNIFWTPIQLFNELEKEHKAFTLNRS